jgi:ring-1,2-phenylacetyl-CoA epoxidase subunit PaaD
MVTNVIERIKKRMHSVMDPELPFLTVMELGMIRGISMEENTAVIELTPTYTGCPATDAITEDIQNAAEEIHADVCVRLVMSPAWTTDWINEETRSKMSEHGVAPPEGKSADKAFLLGDERIVPCPRCKTNRTKLVSPFGSTACKAHFTCLECLEPFDHFKCI